jgi:MFS family permease
MDSTAPAPVNTFPALINRNFALLWSGGAISNVGDFVFDTTLVLWIATSLAAGQSWAPLAVSGLLLAVLVPSLLLGPLAGVFVDRWDKRRTMLAMDALRTVLIAFLLVIPALGSRLPVGVQLGTVYAIVVLATVCAQFFGPSRIALIGDIVPPEAQTKASGLTQITISLAVIVGPPIAGPLFVGLGIRWALIINALSFVVSFVSILAMRAPQSARSVAAGERGNVLREFAEGLRFFASSRTLRTMTVAVVTVMVGAGSINALDVFFATTNLHASPALYGWLGGAFGAGALLGGIGASVLAGRLGPARLFWIGILGGAVGIFVFSRMTSFVPGVIMLFLIAIPVAGCNVAVMPLLLAVTPRTLIGRVTGVFEPLISLASIASIAIAAVLVSTLLSGFHHTIGPVTFGPVDTIYSAAAVLCLVAGIYALFKLHPEQEAQPNGMNQGADAA